MNDYPHRMSLYGHGRTRHAARLVPNSGTGIYETACGLHGKPGNPADTVDCPPCTRANNPKEKP